MDDYVVWSCKLQSWWLRSSAYGTDFAQAKHFTREEAIKFCKARYVRDIHDLPALPVFYPDLIEVMA